MKTKKKTKAKKPKEQVFQRRSDILSRPNADKTVSILDMSDPKHYFVIDGLAAKIWMLIDGKKNLKLIKSTLAKEVGEHQARFEKDVDRFIQNLKKMKLLEPTNARSASGSRRKT